MTNIADDIRVNQQFDPEGENGGYKFETVEDDYTTVELKWPRRWDFNPSPDHMIDAFNRAAGKVAELGFLYGKAEEKDEDHQKDFYASAIKYMRENRWGACPAEAMDFSAAEARTLEFLGNPCGEVILDESHDTHKLPKDGFASGGSFSVNGAKTGRWTGGEGE